MTREIRTTLGVALLGWCLGGCNSGWVGELSEDSGSTSTSGASLTSSTAGTTTDAPIWYLDRDDDGYGSLEEWTQAAMAPAGHVAEAGDCDDWNTTVYPGADEICDGLDNDCDERIDMDAVDAEDWYGDADADGYGGGEPTISCEAPGGALADATDCDDDDADNHPGAPERCDEIDNDCDGIIDEELVNEWIIDADGDGWGDDDAEPIDDCNPSGEYVNNAGDCDDDDDTINPDGSEICDGQDNDCDDDVDEDAEDAEEFHADADGDGYGDADETTMACEPPPGFVDDNDDCDDTDDDVYPGAEDACWDGVDGDCDGVTICAVSLSDATAKLTGEVEADYLGLSVAPGGDLDGDGEDDFVTASPYHTSGGEDAGAAYVITDIPSGTTSVGDVAHRLIGEEDDRASAIAGPGDLDGDGLADLVVGAWGNDAAHGIAYIVLGPITGDLSLSGADGMLIGESSADLAGFAVAAAGDGDGDGLPDVLVGAYKDDDGGEDAGAIYLITGAPSGSLDLSDAHAKLTGVTTEDVAGRALSGGDINGDGIADVVVGAYGIDDYENEPNESDGEEDFRGGAYLALGPLSGEQSLADAQALYSGESSADYAGYDVAVVGDINGDGAEDFVVGAYQESSAADEAGAVYVIYGVATGDVSLSMADAKLTGEDTDATAGRDVAAAGDFNDDGFMDIAVGADSDDDGGSDAGAGYVIYGPISGTASLKAADVKVTGEQANDNAGASVATAGDVDGDGRDDLLIGTYHEDAAGDNAGATYLLLADSVE